MLLLNLENNNCCYEGGEQSKQHKAEAKHSKEQNRAGGWAQVAHGVSHKGSERKPIQTLRLYVAYQKKGETESPTAMVINKRPSQKESGLCVPVSQVQAGIWRL